MQHAINNKNKKEGVALLKHVVSKFRGYPDNIIGRGIGVKTRAPKIQQTIRNKLYFDRGDYLTLYAKGNKKELKIVQDFRETQ